MRPLAGVWLAALLVMTPGCADLFKSLQAEERIGPERSLLFGTVRVASMPVSIEEIAFERVSPIPVRRIVLTHTLRFRLARAKLLDGGAFLVPNLPAGVYQLKWVRQAGTTWQVGDDDELLRVEITEPGVYDAGAFVIHGEARLTRETQPDQTSRYAQLLSATRGTAWAPLAERLAEQMGVR